MSAWLLADKYEPANIPEPKLKHSSVRGLFSGDSLLAPVTSLSTSIMPILPQCKTSRRTTHKGFFTTKRVTSRCAGKVESTGKNSGAGNQYRYLLEEASTAKKAQRLLKAQQRANKDLPQLLPELLPELLPL